MKNVFLFIPIRDCIHEKKKMYFHKIISGILYFIMFTVTHKLTERSTEKQTYVVKQHYRMKNFMISNIVYFNKVHNISRGP